MLTNKTPHTNPLRDNITNAYRMNETDCVKNLLKSAHLTDKNLQSIEKIAKELVKSTREYHKRQGKIDTLLHQYDLSTDEGIALMCLAEALLRIPDKATMDRFISDKLSTVEWKNHLSTSHPLFVNAATWSLLLSGTIYSPSKDHESSLGKSLLKAGSKVGASVIRPIILQMMKAIGNQFVMGQTIEAAIKRAEKIQAAGYQFSYDMLGEAARTMEDADAYYDSYVEAIDAIGKAANGGSPPKNPGISVKLSALHPRYEYNQYERTITEVTPKLLSLAQQAKKYNIGFTVDAEEADRLDLSLDIIEKIFTDPSLDDWEGFGIAVQAYQKRAPYVIDWLIDLSKKQKKRMMVRLVKGAYWDAEIKVSQVMGFNGYPVFTRKNTTDVAYRVCAQKLFNHPECFFPQFGTHNCYTVADIMNMAGDNRDFEFQCLHGMGRPLYDKVVDKEAYDMPCRIYAPVGTHRDLLGYLVRRLLENGANSSFVNRLADETIPMDKIVFDPVSKVAPLTNAQHPKIPLPKAIYGDRPNSHGIDLSNDHSLFTLKQAMEKCDKKQLKIGSVINGKVRKNAEPKTIFSPANLELIVGYASRATEEDVEEAISVAKQTELTWGRTDVEERSAILEKAAEIFERETPALATLLAREAGKTLPDCIAEIRETIDFCNYYAMRARIDMKPIDLTGPTGESNQLCLHPRGTVGCISPWNFPLAIFSGQVVAALATGNCVLTKPAEQTPLIAYKAVEILHEAGIPKGALQLLIGRGSIVGAKMVSDPRVAGIMFTGSTETAKHIEKSLANRESGPIGFLIAETGGQNAMIVDSSALPEQAVFDIAQSAFMSAGQRCSALRVLFVQEEIAPKLLKMLEGYMQELVVSEPSLISTDIGPVIDKNSLHMLTTHFDKMLQEGKLLAQVPLSNTNDGHFFAPAMFEIDSLDRLEGEVFGPILHVIKYRGGELDKVMDAIQATGYGLTLGVHSRIDSTSDYITSRMPVGNMYVNRNMVGAVVGVQPFGGEGLSGTGPKAGGPHYLPRLCVERTISTNTVAVGGNARLVSLLEE